MIRPSPISTSLYRNSGTSLVGKRKPTIRARSRIPCEDKCLVSPNPRGKRLGIVPERCGILSANRGFKDHPRGLLTQNGAGRCVIRRNIKPGHMGLPRRTTRSGNRVLDRQCIVIIPVLQEIGGLVRFRVVNSDKDLVDGINSESNGGTEHVRTFSVFSLRRHSEVTYVCPPRDADGR